MVFIQIIKYLKTVVIKNIKWSLWQYFSVPILSLPSDSPSSNLSFLFNRPTCLLNVSIGKKLCPLHMHAQTHILTHIHTFIHTYIHEIIHTEISSSCKIGGEMCLRGTFNFEIAAKSWFLKIWYTFRLLRRRIKKQN